MKTPKLKPNLILCIFTLTAACSGTDGEQTNQSQHPVCIQDCLMGGTPIDTNGDGCNDSCVPQQCQIAIDCVPGYVLQDLDGDGCDDHCVPAGCLELPIAPCPEGQVPADTDGDGCMDGCEDEQVHCEAYPSCDDGDYEVSSPDECLPRDANCYRRYICGYTIWCTGHGRLCGESIICESGIPIDTDGDGCEDDCSVQECPPNAIRCANGEPIDTDGDGCQDSCSNSQCPEILMICAEGQILIDSDGDGCRDACVPEPCNDNDNSHHHPHHHH